MNNSKLIPNWVLATDGFGNGESMIRLPKGDASFPVGIIFGNGYGYGAGSHFLDYLDSNDNQEEDCKYSFTNQIAFLKKDFEDGKV